MKALTMELQLLARNRAVTLLCVAYLVVLVMALFIGKQRYAEDVQATAELRSHHRADTQAWQQKVAAEGAGYAAYYLFQAVVFEASPWSALFSGERSENLALQRVRLLSVHGQIHGSPIRNAEHAVLGNLDVGFVFLYLMPVLIGLISVSCIADDRRLGRWPLIAALTAATTLVSRRLTLRFLTVLAINLAVLVLALILLPIAVDGILLKVVLLLMAYQVFWFAVAGLIVFLYLNARQSILSFLTVWIVSVWVVPSLHYTSQLGSDTYNTGIELLVKQRQDINDSWDRNKKEDLAAFLERYPQWADTAALGDGFDWKWYFAMQKSSDDKVETLAEQYFHTRANTQSALQWLSPTLVAQGMLEDLADSGARDQQDFLQAIVDWHRATQDFWFPYLFFDKRISAADLEEIPQFFFAARDDDSLYPLWYWLALVAGLGFALALAGGKERWLRVASE